MRLLYPDYTKLVIAAYKKKQKNSELSPLLATFTRASIRQECLNVYTERLKKGEREEANTLKAFFGVPNEGKDFSSLIERSELDRFRPLENLMKNKIQSPVLATVEILAWLIDFKHRPYAMGVDVLLNGEERSILEKPVVDPGNTQEPEELSIGTNPIYDAGTNQEPMVEAKKAFLKNKKEKDKLPNGKDGRPAWGMLIDRKKMAIAAILIAAICIGGTYMVGQRERPKPLSLGNVSTGCMYWAGDHYDTMSCTEKRSDRFPFPLDVEKMRNFKRITREDTITEKSIGKIYYIRIDGRIEYYTMGGHHPVDVTRTLQVLSSYMFFKHLDKQEIANKDPAVDENPKFINNR
jgi:hypothetical protein